MSYQHFEYTENLARSLKDIAHADDKKRFYRATGQTTNQDLTNNFSSVRGTIMVAIDGQMMDYDWRNSDNLVEKQRVGILILQPTSSVNSDSIFLAQKNCGVLARECINKIMNDAYNYRFDCDKIDPSSFEITGEGPIIDTFYGVSLFYTLNYGRSYRLNSEMWL